MKKKKLLRRLLFIVFLLCLVFGIFCCIKSFMPKKSDKVKQKKEDNNIIEEKEKYPKIYDLSMVMTGDVLIHSSVYQDASLGNGNYDFTKDFEYIAPIISNYDLAYYNQETIIGGKDLGLSTYPRFNSPDEIGDCMVNMGFNLVSLATNHTLDRGEKAVLYSTNYWKNKDVLATGSFASEEDRNEVVVKEKNNIKYGMLSYTTVTNGLTPPSGKEYLTNIYSNEKAKADIEKLRDKVDVLFVAMHWGIEYSSVASEEQKKIATYLSDLGVDVIIGTHPHVLQPIEYINDTLVIYSLGNIISAQEGVQKLTGALLTLNIKKTLNEDGTSSIDLSDVNGELVYTKYTTGGSYWKNFKVIPYSQLNDEILPNYKTYYEKYSSVLKQYDNTITVSSME